MAQSLPKSAIGHPADGTPYRTTLERLHDWWLRIAAAVLPAGGDSAARTRSQSLTQMQHLLKTCRLQGGGEVAARGRAARIAALYRAADAPHRALMLNMISHAFSPDCLKVAQAVDAMQSAADAVESSRAEAQLRTALDAPRARFLAQFNLLPDGIRFLLDLRADLLTALPKAPDLEVLRVELDGLLANWFDPGFLELKRISWQSPALILEKLMVYEAVHPIESWSDLRNRLDTDRRCYAFFHPWMQNEPLIFVEIALLKGEPAGVQPLLDQTAPVLDPRTADTAIFYSISNTQRGLRGISFGNLLLKRVIDDLRRNLTQLKVFATLSPLPGFRKWCERMASEGGLPLARAHAAKLAEALGADQYEVSLSAVLAQPDWSRDVRLSEVLRAPMEQLCAHYLLKGKSDGQPLDPVARFHLSNGARIQRLLWLGDTSERGIRQSFGMMVSYRYDLDQVTRNHERFLRNGQIAASSSVLGHLA